MADALLHDPRRASSRAARSIGRGGRLALSLALIAGCRAGARPEPLPPAPRDAVVPGVSWIPPRERSEAADPPITLTTASGTRLRLVGVKATVWIEAPLALTELHLTFEGSEGAGVGGDLELELPPRSAVARFATPMHGPWMEGEVVALQDAFLSFAPLLRRRQEPAPRERDAGGRLRARVPSSPARGRHELIVTYSQELTGARPSYRLRLAGLPRLDSLEVRVFGPDPAHPGGGIELYRARESAVESPRDLELPAGDEAQGVGLRSGDLVLAPITIEAGAAAVAPPRAVTVLFDTSGSQAARFGEKVARLAALVDRLGAVHGAALPVRVWCFDQEAVEVYRGPAGELSVAHVEAVFRRRAFGTSDLARALRSIRAGVQAGERVVIIGDGVATAGEAGADALTMEAQALRRAGVARIDAILTGGDRDLAAMRRLVAIDAGPGAGVVIDGSLPTHEIVEKLRRPTLSGTRVLVPGSRWSWPDRLDGVQPGDTVLVYAELPEDQALQVSLDDGRTSRRVATRTAWRPLLERAWAGARIARLVALRSEVPRGDVDLRRALRDRVVELSRTYRILSPFTGLAVPASEGDRRRFRLARDGLADLLVFGVRTPVTQPHRGAHLPEFSGVAGVASALEESGRGGEDGTEPDSDGDGLLDGDDPCPFAPETDNHHEDEDGCWDEDPYWSQPPPRYRGSIAGVDFEAGSAELRGASRGTLDRAASTLKEFYCLSIEVSGHRAPGERPEVSQRRAAAVRRYLVDQGVHEERLTIRDAGAEAPASAPRAPGGRARGRRAEFKIVGQECSKRQRAWASEPPDLPAHTGTFAEVMAALANDPRRAEVVARAWCDREPGNALAVIALGEALAAAGELRGAARVYGSLIDLDPVRADLRRDAGQRLAALGEVGLAPAIDSYAVAVRQRPDQPTGHHLYAQALASVGRHEEAFEAIVAGFGGARSFPTDQALRIQAGWFAAAWVALAPERRAEIEPRLQRWQIELPRGPSTSFVLTWADDASDLDLHVRDGAGGHASFQRPELASGGAFVTGDVTSGSGPEMFTIRGAPTAYPYTLEVHAFNPGTKAHTTGSLQIVEHDGEGGLRVHERPFVIMNVGARISLGQVTRPGP